MQNVLAQNPRFYCSPTSGVLDLLYAARQNFTTLDEFKLQPEGSLKPGWLGFCRGSLEGFYAGMTDKPVVVDKSRGWIAYYPWLRSFYPDPKIIVCVRDIRAVLSSMEKLHRKNAHLHDPSENPGQVQGITVEQRVEHWMKSPPVGLALNRLYNAIQVGTAKNFLFVVYEHFMADPQKTMDNLYAHLGEERFTHDFSAIEQKVDENDSIHGVYGDHKIRSIISPPEQDWDDVLGKQLSAAIVQNNTWFYRYFYP